MAVKRAADGVPWVGAPWKLIQASIVAVIVASTWMRQLKLGFWVDEAGSFWMAREGWREAVSRTVDWPGQSVAYSIIASFFSRPEDPHFEVWLRIPSLLAAAVAGWLLHSISSQWFGPNTAWLAIAVASSAPQVAQAATEARPYIFAVAFALAGIMLFTSWLERARWSLAVAAGLCFALMVHFHLLFGFLLLAPAIWIGAEVYNGRGVRWSQLALGLAAMAGACLPLAPVLWKLLSNVHLAKDAVGYVSAAQFIEALGLGGPAGAFLIAWLSAAAVWPGEGPCIWKERGMLQSFRVLVWWLVPASTFWLLAKVGGASANPRYFLYASPAFALLLASLSRELSHRRVTALISAMAALILVQNYSLPPLRSDCAATYRAVSALPEGSTAPVVVQSMLVESNQLDWRKPSESAPQLHACLDSYPLPNPKHFLPLTLDAMAEAEIDSLIDGPLAGARFYMLGAGYLGGQQLVQRVEDAASRRGFNVIRHSRGFLRLSEFVPEKK